MPLDIIRKGEPWTDHSNLDAGGKGLNLLRLSGLEKKLGFEVPDFYIIPVGMDCEGKYGDLLDIIKRPVAIRSSSPYEDSKGYSFAGRFESYLNVGFLADFVVDIESVQESATGDKAKNYAEQYGLTIDEKMAVIVQKMVDPLFSGVCYSTSNKENPKTIIEYVDGFSHNLMSGDKQGEIVSFDKDLNMFDDFVEFETWKKQNSEALKKIASVSRSLEEIFNEPLDIEFAVSKRNTLYILQARPVTDPSWPQITLPKVEPSKMLLTSDIVRGSGEFTGPAFVLLSFDELKRRTDYKNDEAKFWYVKKILSDRYDDLKKFNRLHKEGYILIADSLNAHKNILGKGLSNMKALVTVNYASRFSHPMKVVSETGAFYIGTTGMASLLDKINTGDTVSVASDQSRGILFDLFKEKMELQKANLEDYIIMEYNEAALKFYRPSWEEMPDYIFIKDRKEDMGIAILDYDEVGGIPTQVFYSVVKKGCWVIHNEEYNSSKMPHGPNGVVLGMHNFPNLMMYLFMDAKKKIEELEKTKNLSYLS